MSSPTAIWTAEVLCLPTASLGDGSSTGTATCSPTTSSASDDGPRILDCLEFDDRLRWGDVLLDVGFLAMDLERLGRPDLARMFLDWYREFSAETHPSSLEHHYIAYRALVRSKISCLRGGADDQIEALDYLAQCQHHLLDARVQLIVIGGLPGTGKSTLARGLGDELGWPVLRSDEIRKEQVGLDPTSAIAGTLRRGDLLAERDRDDLRGVARPGRRAARERSQRHPRRVVLEGTGGELRRRHSPPRRLPISPSCDACYRPTSPPLVSLGERRASTMHPTPRPPWRRRWSTISTAGRAHVVVDTIRPMPAILSDVLDRIGATHVPPATPGAGRPVT